MTNPMCTAWKPIMNPAQHQKRWFFLNDKSVRESSSSHHCCACYYQVEHFPVSLMCGSERERGVCVCVWVCVWVSACTRVCVCVMRDSETDDDDDERDWSDERDWHDKRESCNWLVYLGDVPLSQPEFQWHYLTLCVCVHKRESVMREGLRREMMTMRERSMWQERKREIDVTREWESCNWLVYSGDVPLSQPEFQWHHTKSASSCAAKHTTKTATLLLHQQAHDQMTALFKVNQQRLKSDV